MISSTARSESQIRRTARLLARGMRGLEASLKDRAGESGRRRLGAPDSAIDATTSRDCIAAGVADQLFLDDQDRIVADYLAYDEPEFVAGQEPWKHVA